MPFTPYLNTEEIESALEVMSHDHPDLAQLITLPNTTYEGRTCHAIRLSAGATPKRTGVLFIGGVHAREWGSSDILISFMENLVFAYTHNTGLTFEGKSYTATEIQRIMQTVDIYIFPNVNPDGKTYSQSGHDWRKNRRPLGSDIGIDVNRNYDFLWDANQYFDPSMYFGYLYSPSSQTYHGPTPFSEAESRNVRWLIDTCPNIAFFVDFHSYGQKIMYNWSHDEIQTSEMEQNFANAAYNGHRGIPGDDYSEFMFAFDRQKILAAASRMQNAIFAVRGKSYSAGQIFDQVGVSAGDSAGYTFGRHFLDPTKRKIYSFGIEWGNTFIPEPTEMEHIINDIGAALTEFCLFTAEPNLLIRDNLEDTGKEPSTGSFSASPDIIVKNNPVANPNLAFGNINSDPGSDPVEIGNTNYLYVRVHNTGGQAADATVRLYYAPLTTSVLPAAWVFIGETLVINIPAGGFKVSNAILWSNVPDPGTAGHFCLIAVCGNAYDPFPDTAMIDSTMDFIKFMQSSNNIAYRNILHKNTVPDNWLEIPFIMHSFPKLKEGYDLLIDGSKLPAGSEIQIRIGKTILKPEEVHLEKIIRSKLTEREEIFKLDGNTLGLIRNIRLSTSRATRLVLAVKLSSKAEKKKEYPVAIVQKFNSHEMGRITVILRSF